jgi:predicted MFS family arabinose efflux permease
VALGTAQLIGWGSTYYLPAIIGAPLGRDLGLSSATVFGAVSLALLVSALAGPVAGRAIDRLGGRDVLGLSSLVFAAGLALLGLAEGPGLLFAAWVAIGAAMGIGLYDSAFATLVRLYGRDARRTITGITLIAGLASTVAWPISAAIEAEFGWRAVCFFWAAVHLGLGLPLYRLALPAATPVAVPAPVAAARASPREGSRALVLLAFVFAVGWFVSTAMAAHLPRLLETAGATPAAAILAAALVGPGQVAGRLAEFGLMQRLHPLLSARAAVLAHPLAATALIGLGAPAVVPFALVHGAGNGILTIANGTLPLAVFGPGDYGFRQGLLGAPARIAQAVAPLVFALALDAWGLGALWLTAGLGLAAFAALMALRVGPG